MLNESEGLISQSEQDKIFATFFQHGPFWSKIAREIGNRTENQIKNFLNATVRRNVRRFNKQQNPEDQIKTFSLDLLNIQEIRGLLLAEKKCKNEFFRNFAVPENTRRAIEQMAESREAGFGSHLKCFEADLIGNLDKFLVQRRSFEFCD